MKQILSFATGGGPGVSSTTYLGLLSGYNATGTEHPDVAACAGVLRNLRLEWQNAPGTGKSWAVTVLKNGSPTAMTVSVSDSTTVATYVASDVTVAEEDTFSLEFVPSGTPASTAIRWSVEFEGTTARQSLYAGPKAAGVTTVTRRTGVFSMPVWTTDAAEEVHSIAAAAGTITKVVGRVTNSALSGVTVTFYIVKNGVTQDGTGGTVNTGITFSSGDLTPTASFSLPVAPGDRLYFEGIASGGNTGFFAMGVQFTATTDGESQVCGTSSTLGTGAGGTGFVAPNGFRMTWLGETTFQHRVGGALTSYTLKHLYARVTQAPGAGDSWTFNPRLNAGDPAGGQTVTISGASDVAGADTSGFFQVPAETDLVGFKELVGGSPAGGTTAAWGMIQVTATDAAEPADPPGTNAQGLLIQMCFGGSYRTWLKTR